MIRRTDWLFGAAILGLVGGLAMMPSSRGGDIGYIEDFALNGSVIDFAVLG